MDGWITIQSVHDDRQPKNHTHTHVLLQTEQEQEKHNTNTYVYYVPGVKDEPCVNDQERSSVKGHDFGRTVTYGPSNERSHDGSNSNVTLVYLFFPVSGKQFFFGLVGSGEGIGVKVIGHATVLSTCGPNEKVGGPSHHQMEECLERTPYVDSFFQSKGINGPLAALEARRRFILIHSLWDVGLPEFHVVRVLMMDRMRPLPRIIGHEHDTVNGSMTTFVCQDPQSHGDRPSDRRIGRPKGQGQETGRIQHVQCRHPQGGTHGRCGHGHGQIGQRLGVLNLKAILRNDTSNLPRFWKVLNIQRKGLSFQTLKQTK
eukprot:scaffold34015_cov54-Attheya_sp.AAC.2